MASRVLFPGRFQPFHNGHLYVVKRLLESFDEVVIVIGSAQEAFTCRNPFTAGERMLMIRRALVSEGVDDRRIWFVTAPDIRMPPAWTSYVLALAPPATAVATNNPHVAHLYRWLGLRVVEPGLYMRDRCSGTMIRRLIAAGNPSWRSLVPRGVAEAIDDFNGAARITRLCGGGEH